METKNFYDGLHIMTNDSHKTGHSDCTLCCFANSDAECEDCPLKRGFYFAPADSVDSHCSGMSEDDKSKLDEVVKDLLWLEHILKSSRNLSMVYSSTISMVIFDLKLQLQRLSSIKTFDK